MTKLSFGTHPFLLGFEQLERLVERTAKSSEGYPPFKIEATSENAYRITLAVAGFREEDLAITVEDRQLVVRGRQAYFQGTTRTTLRDLFSGGADANTTLEVNRYIWAASLEVLNFLPIESVDPFSGVIVTGYGTPPGGGRSYRATVLVQDPALDARSLKLSLQSRGGGAVDPATVRAVEDAILTRARQLRVQDGKL